MRYKNIVSGQFLSRPNRFVANVRVGEEELVCHVKNTGRCRELLTPGAQVYLERAENLNRKTLYDLVAVQKGERLINMDSQAPNQAVKEWLEEGILFPDVDLIKPEKTYGASRFDFYIETPAEQIFMEVKGVTLEEDGIVRFPDAPTERGIKHIEELIAATKAGYQAYLLFVIQMKQVRYFAPNDVTHPAFGEALRRAQAAGVHLLAYDCVVTADEMRIDEPVEIRL